jgi:hypothetical protein
MRNLFSLGAGLIFLWNCCAVCGADNELSPQEKAAGWKLLFDGRTTKGWHSFKKTTFPSQGWVVEQGCLKHLDKGGGGDLLSDETFEEFELTWEWKIAPKANSGVKYFVSEKRSSALGHEFQMIDDYQGRDGKPVLNKNCTGSFYDVLPPVKNNTKPAGEWNQSRIVVKGNQVEHWLNGEKVLSYELGSEALQAALSKSKFRAVADFGKRIKGSILLQDHGGEVWFRNIKIRDLSGQ